MLVFPSQLVAAATQAGMLVPPNPDGKFNPEMYPHFQVFCNLQLGRPMDWSEPLHNALLIASIPTEELGTTTLQDFLKKGLMYRQ